MARRGDGIYQRGKTWWLDFRHDGRRHVARLGQGDQPHGGGRARQRQARRDPQGRGRHRRPEAEGSHVRQGGRRIPRRGRRRTSDAARSARIGSVSSGSGATFGGRRLGEMSPFDLERYKRGADRRRRARDGQPRDRSASGPSTTGVASGASTTATTRPRSVKAAARVPGPAPLPRARRGGRAPRRGAGSRCAA